MTQRIIRIVLEVLSLLILLATIVFLIVNWAYIPDQVPNHFGGAGQITGWAEKRLVILEPVVMAVIYGSLFFARTMQFRSLGRQVRIPAPPLLFPTMKLVILSGTAYLTICTALVRPLGVVFPRLSRGGLSANDRVQRGGAVQTAIKETGCYWNRSRFFYSSVLRKCSQTALAVFFGTTFSSAATSASRIAFTLRNALSSAALRVFPTPGTSSSAECMEDLLWLS